MVELPLSELISLAEASGIVATFFIIFYFSRKEARNISVEIEAKVLNGLDEKVQAMAEMLIHKPELVIVLDKVVSRRSPEQNFAYYVLYMFAHVFHMRQRKILRDNEWAGWLQWMRNAFDQGTIRDHWESGIEPEKWFDPAFQDFINNEIIRRNKT
jgi:hypothetical protein